MLAAAMFDLAEPDDSRVSDAPELARPSSSLLEMAARRLRSLVRRSEFSLVILAAIIGIAAGLSVALIGTLSSDLHNLLFGLKGERLSGVRHLPRGYAAPILGGLILGVGAWLWNRRRPTIPVDPIEANALHGGRMSLRDSLWVTAQTLLSNGFGGSVGLEAGYAQVGAGLASKLGSMLRLRRNDLRMLVGCGAGGAIGAAFGAPLTGAFYAFELIVGTYTVASAAPILVASLAGVLTAAGGARHHLRDPRRRRRHAQPVGLSERHPARPALRRARHRGHARGLSDRARARLDAPAAGGAAGARRLRADGPGADQPAGAGGRPRRAHRRHSGQAVARTPCSS